MSDARPFLGGPGGNSGDLVTVQDQDPVMDPDQVLVQDQDQDPVTDPDQVLDRLGRWRRRLGLRHSFRRHPWCDSYWHALVVVLTARHPVEIPNS